MAGDGQLVAALDTHIVCWLYAGDLSLLSQKAMQTIESHSVIISPMVKLELQYLFEIGRIVEAPDTIIQSLKQAIDLRLSGSAFEAVVDVSLGVSWTRDVFDRLIVADAMLNRALLVTKDRLIRTHFPESVW